jgi:diguanylate cyclase (GGDEF)-like protein
MLLLTAAVYAVAFPEIDKSENSELTMIALRALVGLVLLFQAFAAYQQVTLRRFRRELSTEMRRLQTIEDRNELLEKLSTVDKLTDLYNRRFMEEHLPLECLRADRGGYPLTLLMIDLNHFKETNDTYGHAAGDAMLQAFSIKLRRAIRAIDLPIRLGGDEFLVCLPECTSEQVQFVVKRIRGGIARFEDKELPIDFAVGWAQRERGEPVDDVLARADQAMYRDKAECHHRESCLIGV